MGYRYSAGVKNAHRTYVHVHMLRVHESQLLEGPRLAL